VRHLLPSRSGVRPGVRPRRRERPSRRPAAERRGAPGREHLRHDLFRPLPGRVRLEHVHARAGRPHPHRDATGRGLGARPEGAVAAGRRRRGRGRGDRRPAEPGSWGMTGLLLVLFAIVSGAFLPLQAGINRHLAHYVGGPVRASMISFFVGAFVLLAVTLLFTRGGARPGDAPWWVWIGGALGAFYVTSTVVVPGRIGVAAYFGIL